MAGFSTSLDKAISYYLIQTCLPQAGIGKKRMF